MEHVAIQAEALRLHKAEKERKQIEATTLRFPEMTIDDAYEIQQEWKSIKLDEGRQIVGHKIGLTSRVMQKNMGIDEPDFGFLLDDMGFEEGSTIEAGAFLDPKIEVELAFILKKDLAGEDLGIADVLDATDYVTPALELIAARSYRMHPDSGYRRTVKDTISDNAANAGIILGKSHHRPDGLDFRWLGAMMSRNGIIEESGVSGAVLGHPALGIAWLAKKYSKYNISLKKGQVILSGSFTRPIDVRAGDSFSVDFNTLGKINCNFS